jgi:hypothetical protein
MTHNGSKHVTVWKLSVYKLAIDCNFLSFIFTTTTTVLLLLLLPPLLIHGYGATHWSNSKLREESRKTEMFRDRRSRSSTCTLPGSTERYATPWAGAAFKPATAVFQRQPYQTEDALNQTTSAVDTEINNNIATYKYRLHKWRRLRYNRLIPRGLGFARLCQASSEILRSVYQMRNGGYELVK